MLDTMLFEVDKKILETSIWLYDEPLSRVFIKNDANTPWFILVPKVADVEEIYQLSMEQRHQLIDEVARLSQTIKDYFKPDKLNTAALGNIVSQLHVHIVARFKKDQLWPQSIWQSALVSVPYDDDRIAELVSFFTRPDY